MNKNFFRKLSGNYADGKASDKEKALLDAYFDYAQDKVANKKVSEFRKDVILNKINNRIDAPLKKSPGINFYYRAAAAVILLAFGLLIIFQLNNQPGSHNGQLTVITKNGEKKKILLPDGSAVILNSGSRIRYAENFRGSLRNVYLEGEAYFDVVHNKQKPFIVHSTKMDVKVLGTLFNVKAYPGEKNEASLIRGSIQIFIPSRKEALVTLKPNENFVLGHVNGSVSNQVVASGKEFMVTQAKQVMATNETRPVEWVHNRISFDDQGFKEVCSLLERWYDVRITIDNPHLLNYRFTGTFNDTGLVDILDALKTSQTFRYRKEGDVIKIY